MKWLSHIFFKPTHLQNAAADLAEAQRQYLKSVSAAEYHAAMSGYYDGVIQRLTDYIQEQSK